MENTKLKKLSPKVKLRELRAIKETDHNFKKPVAKPQDKKIIIDEQISSRDLKKIQLYE